MPNDYLKRYYNNPEGENGGRKLIIESKDLKALKGVLKEYNFSARAFIWE